MNILVDAHVFDDKHQGTRTYLKGLYSKLIPLAKNWKFYMVANNIETLSLEFGFHHNVTFIPLKKNNKYYRLLVELPSIEKKYEIDYTHFQYIGMPLKTSKQIITTHDILFEQEEFKSFFPLKYRYIKSLLFKQSAKRAAILFTVSPFSRQKISELYQIPLSKIYITPNAINEQFLFDLKLDAPQDIKALGKYILYVSRVEPRKNHLALIMAFTELDLAKSGYKLIFIGKNDLAYSKLENYFAKLREPSKSAVLWLKGISNQHLASYYKHCSLFVFPSFAEGFGIPPLEAMASGCKILCSSHTAMKDFGLPESLTFNPHDVDELKHKMSHELSNDVVLTELYDQILAKYNWETIANDFYGVVEQHYKNN